MGIITTNLLNRFWTKGIKPIKESLTKKLDTSKVIASTNITELGFVMDGKTAAEELAELNRKCFKSVKVSDLNYLNPFEYVTFDYAAGYGISNKPVSSMAGVCYALNNLDGVVQLVFNYDESSNFYIRTSYRDVYSEWRSITTTSVM